MNFYGFGGKNIMTRNIYSWSMQRLCEW